MKITDDVFENLSGSFFKLLIDAAGDKNGSAVIRLFLVTLAILAFIGVDITKILFRHNFGKKGLSLTRIILGALLIAASGVSSFVFTAELLNQPDPHILLVSVFILTGTVSCFLAIYAVVKALKEKAKNPPVINEYYRGDSKYFEFLRAEGWSSARIQNLAEPLFMLGIGGFLCGLNPFCGLPLMICAVSVWIHLIFEKFYGVSHVRDKLANLGYQANVNEVFSEASN